MELKNEVVNFLGDSITQGIGASCGSNKYVDVFARKSGAIVNNYGISGTRIARQKSVSEKQSYDLDFCGRYTEMAPDADVVFVFGGTNDFGHGDAPIGEFSDRTPDTFYGALHYLMLGLLERYPDSVIVFATPLHRKVETRDERPPLGVFRGIIKEVAEYYSIPVLDLWAVSGISTNSPVIMEKYVPDGLHPSDAGHEVLADRIIGFLNAL